jgi:hypothetical protein
VGGARGQGVEGADVHAEGKAQLIDTRLACWKEIQRFQDCRGDLNGVVAPISSEATAFRNANRAAVALYVVGHRRRADPWTAGPA